MVHFEGITCPGFGPEALISESNQPMSLIIIIFLFAIAWVVLILPKQRELKRHNALLATLEVGEEVMTGSGIYGTIVAVDGETVVVQVATGVEMKFARRSIAAKVSPPIVDTATDAEDVEDVEDATDTEQ